MSENNEAGSFATTGSGKSEAEVAFELLNKLKGQGVWGERNVGAILDMYAECLDAAKGYRSYQGQKRIEVPVQQAQLPRASQPAQSMPQSTPAQQAAYTQQAPIQPQAQDQPQLHQAQAQQQPVQAQPVHAQQQALQQAYKQG